MIEALKAPLPTILVFAGIIFLLVSVATIKKPIVIEITPTGRIVAGVIGGLILILGIVLFINPPDETPTTNTIATATLIPTTEFVPIDAANITIAPTNIPTIPTPITLTPPSLRVDRLELPFQSKSDLPPIVFVSRKTLTSGAVKNFDSNNFAIRVFICSQTNDVCVSQELPYLDSARWDKEIEIGTETDDCARYYLRFAIISKVVNDNINSTPRFAVSNTSLPKFIDVENYEVKRALNSDHSPLNVACP